MQDTPRPNGYTPTDWTDPQGNALPALPWDLATFDRSTAPTRANDHANGFTALAMDRSACARCSTPTAPARLLVGGYCADCAAAVDLDDTGDGWTCPACSTDNYPSDDECMSCGSTRPDPDNCDHSCGGAGVACSICGPRDDLASGDAMDRATDTPTDTPDDSIEPERFTLGGAPTRAVCVACGSCSYHVATVPATDTAPKRMPRCAFYDVTMGATRPACGHYVEESAPTLDTMNEDPAEDLAALLDCGPFDPRRALPLLDEIAAATEGGATRPGAYELWYQAPADDLDGPATFWTIREWDPREVEALGMTWFDYIAEKIADEARDYEHAAEHATPGEDYRHQYHIALALANGPGFTDPHEGDPDPYTVPRPLAVLGEGDEECGECGEPKGEHVCDDCGRPVPLDDFAGGYVHRWNYALGELRTVCDECSGDIEYTDPEDLAPVEQTPTAVPCLDCETLDCRARGTNPAGCPDWTPDNPTPAPTLADIAEGLNAITDNAGEWTPEQIARHAQSLRLDLDRIIG